MTIFSKIIAREIPAQILYEDDCCIVIMDKFPIVEGQSLVILKREVDYLFDTTDDEYAHLLQVAKKVAKASDVALAVARTCLIVEGFEVPHVHVKLYPMPHGATFRILAQNTAELPPPTDAKLTELATKITEAL